MSKADSTRGFRFVLAIVAILLSVSTMTVTAQTKQTTALKIKPVLDLAVVDIKQDWEDYNTRYRPQFTIKNIGNAPLTQTVIVEADALPELSPTGPITMFFETHSGKTFSIGPLAPGASVTLHLPDKYLATTPVNVLVLVDPNRQSPDVNRPNNEGSKILGPH